jgi:hypothetical protein
MALQYIRFTELDPVSSVASGDILPVVETVTNINKKITVGNFNDSLPLGADVAVFKAASGNWDSNYSTSNSNSANWSSVYSSVNSVSSNWNIANEYSSVYSSNSGKYESVYSSFNSNSATYDNTVRYPNWDSNYTTTNTNSARWSSVYNSFNTLSTGGFTPFIGAGIASNGTQGLVPAPQGGDDNANLAGDGTFHLNVWDQAQPPGSYAVGVSYYEPFMGYPTVRNLTINSNFIYLIPFRVTHTITVSAVRLQNNSVASSAGTTAKLAIYKWRTQYSKPRATDLVSSQFGILDMTQTGGLMSYATSPLSLIRGLYFVAFAASATTGTVGGFTDLRLHAQLFAQGDYAQAWPAAGFPNTPSIAIADTGLTYATLWPSSLSPNSAGYNIRQIDSMTPVVHLIGTP